MKHSARQLALRVAEALGVNRFFRRRTRHRLLGLCYHGVLEGDVPWDDPRTEIAVSASQFERQMRELRRHWNPTALSTLDDLFRRGDAIPERSVFVSFDDGFLNNLTVAAPILERYEIPATIFLTTDLIGTERTIWPLEVAERVVQWPDTTIPFPASDDRHALPPQGLRRIALAGEIVEHCKTLPDDRRRDYLARLRDRDSMGRPLAWQDGLYRMLDWKQVQALRDRGVEFGAHTASHVNLARSPLDRAEVELRTSKEEIERRLGVDCFALAYPFGDSGAFCDSVIETARQLGFRVGTTLCMRRNPERPDPMRLDRIAVTGDLSLASFQALISGWRNAF